MRTATVLLALVSNLCFAQSSPPSPPSSSTSAPTFLPSSASTVFANCPIKIYGRLSTSIKDGLNVYRGPEGMNILLVNIQQAGNQPFPLQELQSQKQAIILVDTAGKDVRRFELTNETDGRASIARSPLVTALYNQNGVASVIAYASIDASAGTEFFLIIPNTDGKRCKVILD